MARATAPHVPNSQSCCHRRFPQAVFRDRWWSRSRKITALIAAAVVIAHIALGYDPKDYSVLLEATATTAPASIRVSWVADPQASAYVVSRKSPTATAWTSLASLAGSVTSYTDSTAQVGQTYEYQVQRTASGVGGQYVGVGFLQGGIDLPLVESRGKIVLVVDGTFAADLVGELNRLTLDLVGDGWQVIRHDVARTATSASVKNLIKTDYNAAPTQVKAVMLFGHVPVPYSGNLMPDGHPEHKGAWPADLSYGDVDGTYTDNTVSTTSAARIENRNVPGDVKFDTSTVPSANGKLEVELAVGRVDLANLPSFPQPEKELLRNYLNKDHVYRHGWMNVQKRGIIDDNFGMATGEAFAANGWRNFPALVGSNATGTGDWMETTQSSALFAYGCGGGSYGSVGGVAITTDFAVKNLKIVFHLMVGSYFGDWDSADNVLRAPLAGGTHGLASMWAGRPDWFLHPMAMGETLGYCARLTQNNRGLYTDAYGTNQVHVALMGDPTLRLYPVEPPSKLRGTPDTGGSLVLNWQSPVEPVAGYHVYAANSVNGPYIRQTPSLLPGTTFTYSANSAGKTFMVRAIRRETSPSGTFFNGSQGVFVGAGIASSAEPDTDSDGIPDSWEKWSGLNAVDANDAASDADDDGASNLDEYRAGTDPQSAASRFRIAAVQKSAGDVRISFLTAVGRQYVAKRTDAIGGPWVDFGVPVLGTGGVVEIVDLGSASLSQRFYRLEVSPAN